jgi:sec-independent protein translocase protein TatA
VQGTLPLGEHASLVDMGIENPVHILFLAAVALVVLGPKRLPELARAAGKSMREFREALNGGVVEEELTGGQVVQQTEPPVGDQALQRAAAQATVPLPQIAAGSEGTEQTPRTPPQAPG